jgi:hypothetical protein
MRGDGEAPASIPKEERDGGGVMFVCFREQSD